MIPNGMNPRDFPILYVDDENANRVVMKHNLGHRFTLLLAASADEALEILKRVRVTVLLADQRMPRVTGVDLAEQVLHRYPEVVRVIITAYSDLEATVDAINRAHVNRFIKKPWTREELTAVMEESILTYQNGQLIKEMQGRLMQLDRVASVGVLASSIAHDLNQILNLIVPNANELRLELEDLLKSSLSPLRTHERLLKMQQVMEDVTGGIDRFNFMSESLLTFLRTQDHTHEVIDLVKVVNKALAFTQQLVRSEGELVKEIPPEKVCVMGSESRGIQLLINLLTNAVQSLPEKGEVFRPKVEVKLRREEEMAVLEVKDEGCGIPPENLENIFAPLWTTKGRLGTGLGLPICKQIVEEMNGSIAVESIPGQGTRFVVRFPRLPR